jgi:hypothetical protein
VAILFVGMLVSLVGRNLDDMYWRWGYPNGWLIWRIMEGKAQPNWMVTGVGMVIQLVGVWLVTAREPGAKINRFGWRVWAWRSSTVAGVAASFVFVVAGLGWLPAYWVMRSNWPWLRVNVWDVVAGVLWAGYAVSPALGFWHLRWLAGRIGRPKMAEYAGIVGVALSILLLAGALSDWQTEYEQLFLQWGEVGRYLPAWVLPAEVGAPVSLLLVLALQGWRKRNREQMLAALWGAVAWGTASGLSVARHHAEASRSVSKMIAVVAVPGVAAGVFYVWGVLLPGRMVVKFWQAAREAAALWRREDAAASEGLRR